MGHAVHKLLELAGMGTAACDCNERDDAQEGVGALSTRQVKLETAYEDVVAVLGKFDQGKGPDGAHYAPASANPFKAEGLVCSNCSMFLAPNGCEVVEGYIEPDAICKLWVIPQSALIEGGASV